MARVFISYANTDSGKAEEIRAWLRADGHEVFLDRSAEDGLRVGQDWKRHLYAVLREADAVVCVVSPAFRASAWCTAEIAVADARGCLVLPLQVAGGGPHPVIESLQYADYEADPGGVRERVLGQLREIDGNGQGGWREGDNPYPGLAAFTEASAPVFFGRGRETRALAERVRESAAGGPAVVALSGPSGCGKSSLLAAGLVPHLRADRSWLALPPFTPAGDPVARLVLRLVEAGRAQGWDWPVQVVRSRLDGSEAGLADLATDLLATTAGSEHRRLLVIVDQGEELFTRADPARVDRFFRLVQAAADGPVRTLVGLRSEFLDDLCALPALAGAELGTFLLGPLDTEMLALVIGQPARLAGLRLDPELAPALVADTGGGDALPLLAFTLNRLAEGCRRGDTITLADYHTLRGVHGALTMHADAALSAATATSGLDRAAVLGCLARLATVDDTGRRARRHLDQDTLIPAQRQALAVFVTARLLTSHRDDGGTVWVAPVHEALLTAWEPLATTLAGRSAALASARSVERAAADWDAAGRTESYLWDGDRLTTTLTTLIGGHPAADPTADLTADARAFLGATRAHVDAARLREQHEQRRARRRRTTSLVGTAAILVLAVTAGLVVWQWQAASSARRDAETARAVATSIGMITQADLARDADPRTAMELGAAAYQLNPSPETAADLIDTLVNTRYAGSHTGHADSATRVAFSPDWRTLATGSDDGTVVLWDFTYRTRPTRLGQPLADVGAMMFSPDGRTLATGSEDGTMVLWDFTDRTRPTRLGQPHTDVFPVAFSPDGRTLATINGVGDDGYGGYDATNVVLWDLADRARPTRLGQPLTDAGDVWSAAFSPDGRTLATLGYIGIDKDGNGNEDSTVILWDLAGRARLGQTLTGHEGSTEAVAFSPDGRTLATVSGIDDDGNGGYDAANVVLWDLADRARPTRLGQPLASHTDGVFPVAFSPDGRTLATAGSDDGTLALWDLADRARPTPLAHPPAGPGHEVPLAFSPDGRTLATGSEDGTVVLWDLADRARPTRLGQPLASRNVVWSVAFSPDGRTLAAGSYDGAVVLWDLADRARPTRLGQPLAGPAGSIVSVAFSPDGRTLATVGGTDYVDDDNSGSFDGAVVLWDLADRARPTRLGQPLAGPIDWVWSVVFSPDGRTLATGTDSGTVVLWDLADRARPTRLGQPLAGYNDEQVRSLAFSPDGRTLATGSVSLDNPLVLWDLADRARPTRLGQPLERITGSVSSVAFSPDGRTLATTIAGITGVVLWDLTDRTRPARLGQPLAVSSEIEVSADSLAFSSDGRTLAAGIDDDTVVLWDLTDRTRPTRLGQPLAGHTSSVLSVAFAPDGRTLATGSHDETVILWDLAGLRDIQRDPFAAACARGGNGITEETWKIYAVDIPFQRPCD